MQRPAPARPVINKIAKMRKRILQTGDVTSSEANHLWLDLQSIAQVEVTSEDAGYPIEAALVPEPQKAAAGWRAAGEGEQTIRLLFDEPQRLRRVNLAFRETNAERTQEFELRWSPDGGRSWHSIVRQQWNFSPGGATTQDEDYSVDLVGVTMLELRIVPDISGGPARASLEQLRLA